MSQPAYRLFNVELKRREQLSPALTRFVFGGPEVAEMKTLAADQRIKIFFPDASGQPPSLPGGSEWYQAYRSVEPARRPPMRTYTIRALRAEQEEVDVEFVLHGENGPASAWATHARIGDRLQLAAPNRQYGDDPGGYEWKPPAGVRHILLIADETALPAVAGILEELAGEAEPPVVEAFLEVPGEADILDLPAIPGARLHWLPRHQAGIHSRNGERMIEAARQARLPEREVAGGAAQELEDIDIDEEILWELASPESGSFYAWVAGESAAVMAIRRYLVQERGIDKRHLTLMGYWRLGKVFD
ncbi:siderophore-interacting protein [Pseudomonas aeruginosa]|uniref:SIP domain-containing protein n=14 Tax=Pseudomonas aeruginosa TaxID=287 RepID=A0A8G5S1V1_PSEAI|nr:MULTISPECIES: siderophore-interacting protein [Pseudomonas]MED5480006.1 siderophore-interacting protein [Pseudomonadota bacterium]SAJ33942.1 FAD-binding 9 siderophore-interacting domain-containing protein [Enterobacter cloacae]HCL2714529.1 siderophore-interacting protein [Pseudomonas aeruginosa EF8E]ABJ11219.1 putative siderophore-interacting protein [Pseudomonas aeruginosa UCBPP-PA14]ALY55161.2 siderophore-interacting protein [Pseudomonas aeruginosa]